MQGQPVFTTSGIQDAVRPQDLQPVRVPNAPLVEPLLRAGPQALRTIGVYRSQVDNQPAVLIVDDRAHGNLLRRMLCTAYGVSEADWHLRRLVEALPSLPPEQYVLEPTSLPWNSVQVPVDLRPLSGRIALYVVNRCDTCGEIAARAIIDQHLGPCPTFLCRTSQGWFHPGSRLLLLPYGDAFQVWPMNQAAVSSVAVEELDGRPPTLEDRFSTSLSLPHVGELAYHDLSGANAVVLHSHGHTYTCVPSYADHLSLRSAALSAVAADLQVLPRGQLCFARLLPPLDRLPAIQFVAAYCGDSDEMGVVDLRPSGGGVYVVQVPVGATPAERIANAVQRYGEPDPASPLQASLAQGHLHVMHREHVVDPFSPLRGAVPAPIVVTRRHSHLVAGYHEPGPVSADGSSFAEHGESPSDFSSGFGGSRLVSLTVWGCCLSVGPWQHRGPGLLAVLAWALVGAVQLPESSSLHSGPPTRSWVTASQVPSLASVEEHATFHRSLAFLDSRSTLGIASSADAGLSMYQFCVWSPGERICFLIEGSSSPVSYKERLLEAKAILGRGACVPWEPQPLDRCMHLISTSTDPSSVSVIVDTGKEYICLEVSGRQPGPAILAALRALCPDQTFRLADSSRQPVRNGDVIRAFSDRAIVPTPPQFQVPLHTLPPFVEDDRQALYVSSVDMGLIKLLVPRGLSAWALERALTTWLGRQRCLGVRLHRLSLESALPVYCLPRRGRSTLVVALVDLADTIMDPVIHVVDDDQPAELDCEVLRDPWRPHSAFWDEVISRGPVCVACWTASVAAPNQGPPFRHVTLGLDLCRAMGDGWQLPIASQVPHYDLVAGAARQGIQWALGHSAIATREVAVQTVASHWPMQASPLFSGALPVPRRAAGCSFHERFGSEGTLFHLDCPQMRVRCTIPCVAGRHIWALRIGNWVHAACTTQLGWDEVLEVASLSYWDLPGTSIHGPEQVWTWPDDLLSLSGQCGHVMHEGSDPVLECLLSDAPPPVRDRSTGEPADSFSPSTRRLWPVFPMMWVWRWPLLSVVSASFMSVQLAEPDSDESSAAPSIFQSSEAHNDEMQDNMTPVMADSSRTCTMAWCHELSCQNTHFATNPSALAEYFERHAPYETVRIHLWLPFHGPAMFDFARGASAQALTAQLQAAGHPPARHSLFVAFDSLSTVVELVSVPPGGSRWWIIRDGLSRELLRPVATWVEDDSRAVVTINSHGQVVSLSASVLCCSLPLRASRLFSWCPTPEVASLYHLPQGARGATATPLTRLYGVVSQGVLAITDSGIGVIGAAVALSVRWGFLACALSQFWAASAMTQDQMVIPRAQAAWSATAGMPRHTCVWTHTLPVPVVLPYADPPDTDGMVAAVAATGHGIRSYGVFAWTNPRLYGDAAHILHYPIGVNPPYVFWLVHYRGRGFVVCATQGPLDWQYLAQETAEALGLPSFLQGTFGIQHNGRVFAFGSDLTAPPHGTILHLVRTGSRVSSGHSSNVWDAPIEMPWIPQFDYNICRGPGESPMRAARVSAPDGPGSCSLREDLQASTLYFQHLLGGLEQSVERCYAVAGSLEARVTGADAAPTAEANGHAPPDESGVATADLSRLFTLLLCRWLGLAGGSRSAVCVVGFLSMCSQQTLAMESVDRVADGPSEPSSPDLTDLQAPTPTATIDPIEVGAEGAEGVLRRPADSPFAHTSAPLRGDLDSPLPGFDSASVPQVQRRVAACLSDVDVSPVPQPFVPHGCPFTVHNPFTRRSQCKIMSEAVQTPQAFRAVVSDFAARRGWQPLVAVHPQPTADSVHLIPAAADPALASVVLRTGQDLHPLCANRASPGHPFRRIVLNGRHGRIREPYSISRGVGNPLSLRDGDCLNVDTGPFGPPPPTPARSAGHRFGLGGWGPLLVGSRVLGRRYLGLPLLFLLAQAVQLLPPAPDGIPIPRYSVGHFPWREPLELQDLRLVCRDRVCRVSLLCTWRGPQGIFQVGRLTGLDDVWRHYAEGGRPSELVPVWPCPTADRLWFVPRVHLAGALRCVVAQFESRFRALAIPADVTQDRLLQTVQYLTGWDVASLRVPPSVYARALTSDSAGHLLRDGDLLDCLPPGCDGGRYIIRSPSDIKDHILWTRSMVIQQPTHVRLWTPSGLPPILTCLSPGSCWDPHALTFSGSFGESFPGMWVPAPWTPCRVPQLVRVAEDPDTANVLFEDGEGIRCLNLDRLATPSELAEGTSDNGRGTRVLGMLSMGTRAPLCLRDGDVVVTGPLLRAEAAAWPDLRGTGRRQHLPSSIECAGCLFLSSVLRVPCVLGCLLVRVAAVPTVVSSPSRGRSRSPAQRRRPECPSPRLGAWQPERLYPMGGVVSRSSCHFQVLCPYRGWGEVGSFSSSAVAAEFHQAVQRDAGTWAASFLPLGGESPEHHVTVLPLSPHPFATVVVHSAETSRALILPAYTTLRTVTQYVVDLLGIAGAQLVAPPALRRVEGYLDETVRLRHGDTFEVALGPEHPRVRRREAIFVPDLLRLPHLNVWHVPTLVGRGGWVTVWGTSASGESQWERVWVPGGSIWSPRWLMFSHQGRAVSTSRWVPAPYLESHDVTFVEQGDIDEAHVLFVQPYDSSATYCKKLILAPGADRGPANLVPSGWQWRPDIEARIVFGWPRNGDILIPRLLGRLFQSGVLAVSVARRVRTWIPGAVILLAGLSSADAVHVVPIGSPSATPDVPVRFSAQSTPGDLLPWIGGLALSRRAGRSWWFMPLLLPAISAGMFAPPLEQQHLPPVPVGKYPWRLRPSDRVCHESVLSRTPARLLSPFLGTSEEVTITPDSHLEEVRVLLSGEEPFWYRDIAPVWPALWQQTLVFVPAPPGEDLVCVVVVSPEWQLSVLLPRRADVEWVLAYLRRMTPGLIASVRPPIATQTPGQSDRDAVDWRSGDVLLAFQRGGAVFSYEPPVFISPAQIRHAAVWSYDFEVHCELPLLVCRVGRKPSGTTMPPPTRWVAAEGAFTGRFRTKYLGRWVPVPWAYFDSIVLCQRAEDPAYRNVLLEQCAGSSLSFDCVTVAASASRYSIAQVAQVSLQQIRLLGHDTESGELPPLRDGDILHYDVTPVPSSSGRSRSALALVGSLCWFSRVGCFLALFGLGEWQVAVIPRHTTLTPHDGATSPAYAVVEVSPQSQCNRGRYCWQAPFAVADGSRRLMSHSLALLSCYLSAFGAPFWERGDTGWHLDMTHVLRLQASLHKTWWNRDLHDGLPTLFPRAYHAAWGSFPLWSGGAPESVFVATDGSGLNGGSWAFLVWGFARGQWYRLGWDCMHMAATPWLGPHYFRLPAAQHSYASELVALQAAAIWLTGRLDMWQLLTGTQPLSVTIAVDNAAALQVAAGSGSAGSPVAATTRVLWQAVQSRLTTHFRHVHSHVGIMASTLVDALANLRLACPCVAQDDGSLGSPLCQVLDDLGPFLWLVNRARLHEGRPTVYLPFLPVPGRPESAVVDDSSPQRKAPDDGSAAATGTGVSAKPPPPKPLSLLTANVQSMKDAPSSIFNPSGHAARRQYLLQQASLIPCDVLCIQEARSKTGRWSTGGWLSWRSGHQKGQYGCEVWIRPEILQPPLGLDDWRILTSSPRILLITCVDARLPLTVCSAHAPHADRPDAEAASFWQDLRLALLRAPSSRGIVLGIDANADFFAQDESGDLIGTRLASGDPGRNDMYLLELCLQLGFTAPATQVDVQVGPGWSWEHTSGLRKRIDHLLFQMGPWEVSSTSQAHDLDLGHSVRDHMPLRASATLRGPAVSPRRPRLRRWTALEILQFGGDIWHTVRNQLPFSATPDQCLDVLLREYSAGLAKRPPRPPVQPKQPYLSPSTVQALSDLRDWRQQLRNVTRAYHACCLHICFRGWRRIAVAPADLAARRDSCRLCAVMLSQERRLSRRVHDQARRDKQQHFLRLTEAATEQWHSEGRAVEALSKL